MPSNQKNRLKRPGPWVELSCFPNNPIFNSLKATFQTAVSLTISILFLLSRLKKKKKQTKHHFSKKTGKAVGGEEMYSQPSPPPPPKKQASFLLPQPRKMHKRGALQLLFLKVMERAQPISLKNNHQMHSYATARL